jgi:hypothetical protein
MDTATMNNWFNTIWADRGSTDEWPSIKLGDCFICNSDILLLQLKTIQNKEQRKWIIAGIEWGLENNFNIGEDEPGYPYNTKIDAFNKLMKKLETAN